MTDAKGGVTSFSYDADRDLLSVTDARGGVTGYSYDNMDLRVSRTDPLTPKATVIRSSNP
jgi:YD repeat-containing protein